MSLSPAQLKSSFLDKSTPSLPVPADCLTALPATPPKISSSPASALGSFSHCLGQKNRGLATLDLNFQAAHFLSTTYLSCQLSPSSASPAATLQPPRPLIHYPPTPALSITPLSVIISFSPSLGSQLSSDSLLAYPSNP